MLSTHIGMLCRLSVPPLHVSAPPPCHVCLSPSHSYPADGDREHLTWEQLAALINRSAVKRENGSSGSGGASKKARKEAAPGAQCMHCFD